MEESLFVGGGMEVLRGMAQHGCPADVRFVVWLNVDVRQMPG